MANEFNVATAAGRTVYLLLQSPNGNFWNTSTEAFETYSTANRSDYAISVTELGTSSGVYQADFPQAITSGGIYTFYAYIQDGGSPAEPDTDVLVATGEIDWTGSGEVDAASGSMSGSDFRDYFLRKGFKRTDKDTEIYEAITDAIQWLRRQFGFQEAQTETTTTDTITSLGDFKLNLESDFGLLTGIVVEDDEEADPLIIVPKWKLDQMYPYLNVTTDQSRPVHAAIYAQQIYLAPVPDLTSYVYRKTYSKRGGTVTASTAAVPFTNLYREILADKVNEFMYELVEDFNKAGYYRQKALVGLRDMMDREEKNSASHVFNVRYRGF